MESKWLEDFLSLARSLNFSRSAEERNVTQPAFSRRIRSLEAWLGVDLVNRNSYPTSLTPAGKIFREVAQELLAKIYGTRKLLQVDGAIDGIVHFAAPHALVPKLLSEWLAGIRSDFGALTPRVVAANTFDSLSSLAEGEGCDFAIVYHHAQVPIALPESRYPCLVLAQETLVPVSATDAKGQAVFRLPGTEAQPIPYIAYPPGIFMGQILELILARAGRPIHLQRCCETDLLEAARSMAVAGRGVSWMPRTLVADDLESGRLAIAGPVAWSESIDIRLYYSLDNRRDLPVRLWAFLNDKKQPIYTDRSADQRLRISGGLASRSASK